MKKLKIFLKIFSLILIIIIAILLLSLQPAFSFYSSNKSMNKFIILGFILLIIFSTVLTKLFDIKILTKKINEDFKSLKGKFIWKPSTPIKSTREVKLIDNHPKDYKFDFKNFELIPNEKVEGVDALNQHIIKHINTPKNKYTIYEGTNYGTEHSLFSTDNSEEFSRQANNLAEQIIDYYGEWIEKIYCIRRSGNYLTMEVKVNGRADTLNIEIPNLDYFINKKSNKPTD